jgi:PDZ domain-containing protein
LDTKEEDFITHFVTANSHADLLFFTDRGKAYQIKMYEVQEGRRATRGKSIMNFLPLSPEERVTSILPMPKSVKETDLAMVLVTKDGTALIGVVGQTKYTYPFEVTINLNDVGGPSAGLMFALGIVDKVTPGEMTGGKNFAGTGTIDAAGNVGPIGGIRQKLYSALAAEAPYFLAPLDNCDEIVGNVPQGLQVFAVATMTEAVTAVSTVASGNEAAISELPTCR